MPEKMKLLGSTKSKISKDEKDENLLHVEITEKLHCNSVNNDYQQDSKVLCTLVPNKSVGQLLNISPKNFIFLKSLNSEFSCIEIWLTDKKSEPLEIEDKINVT